MQLPNRGKRPFVPAVPGMPMPAPMSIEVKAEDVTLKDAFEKEPVVLARSTEERFCFARQALHDLLVQSFWDHNCEQEILARLAYKALKLSKLAAMLAEEKYPINDTD